MLIIYLLAVILASGEYYIGDKYFSVEDRFRADCIVLHVKYQYLGNRSKDINNHDCAAWIEVLKSKPPKSQEHPGEKSLHRKCRSLPLSGNSIQRSEKGSSLYFVENNIGPWCYIKKNGGSYSPSACLPECRGNGTKKRERKPKPYGRTYGLNYNQAIIDKIEKFFKRYDWGPDKYYIEKPSDNILSAEYYRMKQQIFFSCIAAMVLIIIYILGCYCLKRKADNTRRRRDLAMQEIFKEEHGKIPKVISRPAPN